MKTYVFRVILEPDEEGWHIYYPPWASIGASTWGYTREEALYYIKEVLEMIIEEFEEEGTPLPPRNIQGTGQWHTCLCNHVSEIDYSRLRSLPARRLIRALLDGGFTFYRQRGSHHRYRHTDGRCVSVAFTRRGDTIPIGTLQFIVEEQAGWNADDLRRLGLL